MSSTLRITLRRILNVTGPVRRDFLLDTSISHLLFLHLSNRLHAATDISVTDEFAAQREGQGCTHRPTLERKVSAGHPPSGSPTATAHLDAGVCRFSTEAGQTYRLSPV
jgi:hypothetical protein